MRFVLKKEKYYVFLKKSIAKPSDVWYNIYRTLKCSDPDTQ